MAYDDPDDDLPYTTAQAFVLGVIHTLACLKHPVTINGLAKICETDPERIEEIMFQLEEMKALKMEEGSNEISFPSDASPFSDN